MKLIQTLETHQLDYAVAMALGYEYVLVPGLGSVWVPGVTRKSSRGGTDFMPFRGPALADMIDRCEGWPMHSRTIVWEPSRNRDQAMTLLEEHKLCVKIGHAGVWLAYRSQNYEDEERFMTSGSTACEAICRTFVRFMLRVDWVEEQKDL